MWHTMYKEGAMYREIEERIEKFFQGNSGRALMITGARQVGKTYIVREFA